jgi:peptide methionine sulfoxide reductase msrA/msrB
MRQIINNLVSVLCLTALCALAPLSASAEDKMKNRAVAYFAGGCFWCTEADFEKIDGVSTVISGYMGGDKKNPTYEQVAYGTTKHRETVKVIYNPDVVSYQTLLSAFWRMHNPTDGKGSFVDRGRHYGSAIYTVNEMQRRLAEGAVQALNEAKKFKRPIATEIADAKQFYPAEGYHQDYYIKSATKYKFYRYRSGRDQFIRKYWDGDDTLYQIN